MSRAYSTHGIYENAYNILFGKPVDHLKD